MFAQVIPVINRNTWLWCRAPYPDHRKGCPNYGKKKGCPPFTTFFDEEYDLTKPVYAIWNKFDMNAHRERMWGMHPEWSYRQASCCLYWQPTARNQLLERITEFRKLGFTEDIEINPEARGIDFKETMKQLGITLEFPPIGITYQIALAATRKSHIIS